MCRRNCSNWKRDLANRNDRLDNWKSCPSGLGRTVCKQRGEAGQRQGHQGPEGHPQAWAEGEQGAGLPLVWRLCGPVCGGGRRGVDKINK